MFATYDQSPPTAPATKLIATITNDGRVFAVHTDTEPSPSFGLDGTYEREFPLDTLIHPGQLVDTV